MICSIHSEEWYEKNNPAFLHPDSIDSAIKEPNNIKLVKFFTPWCRYCRVIKDYIDEFKAQQGLD